MVSLKKLCISTKIAVNCVDLIILSMHIMLGPKYAQTQHFLYHLHLLEYHQQIIP